MVSKDHIEIENNLYELQLTHIDIVNLLNDEDVYNGKVKNDATFYIHIITTSGTKQRYLTDITPRKSLALGFNNLLFTEETDEYGGADVLPWGN